MKTRAFKKMVNRSKDVVEIAVLEEGVAEVLVDGYVIGVVSATSDDEKYGLEIKGGESHEIDYLCYANEGLGEATELAKRLLAYLFNLKDPEGKTIEIGFSSNYKMAPGTLKNGLL